MFGVNGGLTTPFDPNFCGVLYAESATKTANIPPHELDKNRTSLPLNKFFYHVRSLLQLNGDAV